MNIAAMIKMTVAMAIFGSIGFFTVNTGIPAEELVFVRCICATLFLGGMWFLQVAIKRRSSHAKKLLRRSFVVCFWC
jgi:hypothetical protein